MLTNKKHIETINIPTKLKYALCFLKSGNLSRNFDLDKKMYGDKKYRKLIKHPTLSIIASYPVIFG
jgi:hypothetical protein